MDRDREELKRYIARFRLEDEEGNEITKFQLPTNISFTEKELEEQIASILWMRQSHEWRVKTIQNDKGIVYDGACGSGGMFVQSMKFIQEHQGDTKKISVFGQSRIDEIAKDNFIDTVAKLPINPEFAAMADNGAIEDFSYDYLDSLVSVLAK